MNETKPITPETPPPAPALREWPTLRECLSAKFALPHHVLLWEVRNSTGFDSTRSADALAITMYVSRGHAITGFEIKEHRSDWLAEVKRPEKAEAIAQYCDFFFLVTGSKEIAKLEEIPHPWGWFAFTGKSLKLMKKPERLKCMPLDRAMLCSLIYSTMCRFNCEKAKEMEAEVEKRVASRRLDDSWSMKHELEKLQELSKAVDEFQKTTEIDIRYCRDIPKIGDAVRTLMKNKNALNSYISDLQWIKTRADRTAALLGSEAGRTGIDETEKRRNRGGAGERRRMKNVAIMVAVLILGSFAPARAQTQMTLEIPRPTPPVGMSCGGGGYCSLTGIYLPPAPLPRIEGDRFRGEVRTPSRKIWILEMAAVGVGETFDFTTTSKFDWHWQNESNPVLGKYPSDARIAAYGAIEFAAVGVALHFSERSPHKWVRVAGRSVAGYLAVSHTAAGVYNATRSYPSCGCIR